LDYNNAIANNDKRMKPVPALIFPENIFFIREVMQAFFQVNFISFSREVPACLYHHRENLNGKII